MRAEVEAVEPFDAAEQHTRRDVLDWIDSGAELWRLRKPATPDKHLVAYFPVVDGEYVLLVDHIDAGLWLPTGGHVEPGEHPRDTVVREAREELSVSATFLMDAPLLVTSTRTVGQSAGHADVSLWYVLAGNRHQPVVPDPTEFRSTRWFHMDDVPVDRTDPHLPRFLAKLRARSQ